MASLRWKNYSVCLALLSVKVSSLGEREPLLPMLPPNPYLQMSEEEVHRKRKMGGIFYERTRMSKRSCSPHATDQRSARSRLSSPLWPGSRSFQARVYHR